jgi:TubC N-terminal docking domain
MSAVEALKAARAAGVELALDGDDLALKAASAPPAAVLDALSRHKAEIVALLRPAEDGWSVAPTSTPSSLEKIEAVLRDHGVIVFATSPPVCGWPMTLPLRG